ncbi:disease resistance protein RML1A isoform X2 [Neltuma alba]|nr:disease resistance protein RML1A-like isoform X2 [Prosopis alba]
MAPDAASSSASAKFSIKKYDVFISFRGEDTRANFTSHLYEAFCRKKIRTYIDSKLPKGDEISAALTQAIKDSYASVVVFSENYASSRWCLDELTHILHCKRVQEQIVIPVFYKVEPSHVRNQTGLYKQAFETYERDVKVNQHKVQMWKHALNEAANLAGYDSHTFRDESELIQKTVKDILQKLSHKYPPADLKALVGIDEKCREIELLLRDFETIGIWGMGGIGKSTVAKTIFVKYSSHYEGSCFLENVREKSENGLAELRYKFISCLLKEEDTCTDPLTTFVLSRLSRMKVFVVLDDISTVEQLEYLVGEPFCFGLGSKILITTRDKHVLSKGVDEIYKVKELDFHQSLKLFSLNALNTSLPIMGYEELTKRAVAYAKGIPLALKVLGSYLRGKSEVEWNSALRKLEKTPHENIQRVLRLSYDGLNHEEKNIFLEIACFLKGMLKEHVISLLDCYNFYGAIGIRTLHDKALINANDHMPVEMHDLIQEMGWEIVREESINEPGRRSRLWDCEEIYDVLANNKGTDKLEGIMLDVSRIKDIHLNADTFKRMSNLRFLKFYSDLNHRSSHVYLPKVLEFFPSKIKYLEWYGYPLKSLPPTFRPENLVELHMPNSHVQKLWNGIQDLVNLEEINLSGCKRLKELPNFSKALNLKVVSLVDCESLQYVHSSILSLHSLVELDLCRCKRLRKLKTKFHLKSLQYIRVDECISLKEFSVSSEKIKELNLCHTGIENLHSSIGHSSNLEVLDLFGLRLKKIPKQLSCLRTLTMLRLPNCELLDNSMLHMLFGGMLSLTVVYLTDCSHITELPNNTEHLLRLECLFLSNCRKLRSLPKLPPSIATLDAYNCMSLEIVSTFRPLHRSEKYFSFMNCVKLNEQSLHSIIEDAYSIINAAACRFQQERKAKGARSLICFHGSLVPEWFRYRTEKGSVIIEVLYNSDLLGFSLCVVLQFHSEKSCYVALNCACYLGGFNVANLPYNNLFLPNMNSDHVYIWNNEFGSGEILKAIERRGNEESLTDIKLCFEFSVEPRFGYEVGNINEVVGIKECGVCPLYVSECQKFSPQMEMVKNKKRPRDVDEQQPLIQLKKLKIDYDSHADTCHDIDELKALFMAINIS